MKTITVKGVGKAIKNPDTAIVNITFSVMKENFEDGLHYIDEQVINLKNSFEDIGFDKNEFKTVSFDILQKYNEVEEGIINKEYKDKFVGFEITHELKLEFEFTHEKLVSVFGCLTDFGENIEFELSFSVKDKKQMIREVLLNATQNARFNAEILAEASSLKLGNLVEIDCKISDFCFESYTEIDHNGAGGLGALFSSESITPDKIEISDTVTFVWEII